jgi:hypothetical protein
VGHGEAFADELVAADVVDGAAAASVLAPAVGDVAAADEGDVGGRAMLEGEAVEVQRSSAARREMKGGRHRGTKLARFGQGGEAGEEGVDEHDLAGRTVTARSWTSRSPVVWATRWDVEAVVAVLDAGQVGEGVLEAPELVEGAEPEGVAVGAQAHAAVEAALVDG